MEITKIVTHGGVFHADETLAIAFLHRIFGLVPIEWTFKVSKEDLEDPSVIVLDLGGSYDVHLNNYDHHHDTLSHATNCLVLEAFGRNLAERVGVDTVKLINHLKKHLFEYVSNVDRGLVLEDNIGIPTFNSIIRNFNNVPNGFNFALKLANWTLEGFIATAKLAIQGEEKYMTFERMDSRFPARIQTTTDFIPSWKELAQAEGTFILIQPNLRGGWQAVSRSTDELVLPTSSKSTFRHNSGFMIVFDTFEDCVEYVQSL